MSPHITGKDIILAIIGKIGAAGAVGHVMEYAGSAIRGLSMEGRLTLCNMSIEAGGRAGMVAPDDTTFNYLKGKPFAPKGENWDKAMAFWKTVPTDDGATFDTEVTLNAAEIAPMVTWGTTPEDVLSINGRVPDPASAPDAGKQENMKRALEYMDLKPGTPMDSVAVDRVFIGSCTNSRIEDLRAAAAVAKGRKAQIPAWVVAGSGLIKEQAEAEGLDKIFREAGFDWREPGCSMCIGVNGDVGTRGQRIASTSNRNFVGRQGVRACAPTSSARRWPRRRPSPATSPTCASCWARSTHHGRFHHPHRRRRAARSGQHRHRPDHPGALPRQAAAGPGRRLLPRLPARPQRTGRARA